GGRLGRVTLLIACYAVVGVAVWFVPVCSTTGWLVAWLFVLGACAGAMYPLGLSLLGESVTPAALPRAYAVYLAMECVGSQLGAAVMGRARDLWGDASMFPIGLGAVLGVLACWAAVQIVPRIGALPRPMG